MLCSHLLIRQRSVIDLKIELLDEKTVKVLLSKLDMSNLNLTYDEMDYQKPDTKRIILHLIEKIKKEVKIDFSNGRLFIEAFPYADGGCILYVNIIDQVKKVTEKQKSSFLTPLIFSCDDVDILFKMSNAVFLKYDHIILKSTLHLLDGKYYLSLYTYFKMDDDIIKSVNEYGKFIGKGSILSAFLNEHAKKLIEDNAIKVIMNTLQ